MSADSGHPSWCDPRLHRFFASLGHTRELGHVEFGTLGGDPCEQVVEVTVTRKPEGDRVLLYVSECDGSHPDDELCMAGDGNMVYLSLDDARAVLRHLSHAVSLLARDSATAGATVAASKSLAGVA